MGLFENFPYTNFHDLNADWIIKIVKEFLDNYTSLEETIDTGKSEITELYNTFEGLLNQWYETHSQDIADELADALQTFSETATAEAQRIVATIIPADFTALTTEVEASRKMELVNITTLEDGYVSFSGTTFTFPSWCRGIYYRNNGSLVAIPLSNATVSLPASFTSVVILYWDLSDSQLKIAQSENDYNNLTNETAQIARVQFNGANDPTIIGWNSALPFNYTETQTWRNEVNSALGFTNRPDNIMFTKEFTPASSTRLFSEKGDMWKYHWNTMPAYQSALEHEWIKGVCGDVQWCATGELVMYHDGTVDAQTDGTGAINDLTWTEIAALNIDKGVWNNTTRAWTGMADGSTAKIPTLSQFLDLCRKYGKVAVLEFKCKTGTASLEDFGTSMVDEVIQRIKNRGMQNSVAFIVSRTIIDYIQTNYPEFYQFVDIGSTWTEASTTSASAWNCSPCASITDIANGVQLLRNLHSRQKLVWGYVSKGTTGDYIQSGIDLGLDIISIFTEPTAQQIAYVTSADKMASDIAELQEDTSNLKNTLQYAYDDCLDTYIPKTEECLQGGFNNIATYSDTTANNNANRLHYLIDVTNCNILRIAIGEGYSYYFVAFDSSGNIISRVNEWTTTELNVNIASAKTLRINIKENNNANLNPFMVQATGLVIVFDELPYSFSQLIAVENRFEQEYIRDVKHGILFESGTFAGDGVTKSGNTSRIRTASVIDLAEVSSISMPTGYELSAYLLNGSKVKLTQTGYMTSIDFRMANPSAKYANVFLRKSSDTSGDISADVPIINSGVKIVPAYGYTVELPFDDFTPDLSIIKTQDGYATDFVPQSKYISISNGVTVFLSENGNDSNNGLSVATPKKTIESALAVSNVQTILMLEGTYSAGTHYTAGLTVSQDINIIGLGAVVIDNGNNAPITFTHDLYCENIHFKHGNSNTVIFSANDADTVAVFYKCVFSDSYALNGVRLIGGIGYVVDCVCHDNAYDGFNYHDQNESNTNRTVEIGCTSYNNGLIDLDQDAGNTSNATTSHGSCVIIRVNGDYKACHGAIVADQGKYSVNYGCRAGLSTVTDNAYDYRKANYWATQTCEMWLYDCVSYGSKYDAYDANTAVIHSNVAYASVG